MQIRNLFLLACLLATTFLNATAVFNPTVEPRSCLLLEERCDLPAPGNFHVEAIGPTWVKLAWDPTNPFNEHRVRIFRASDDLLLSTTIVPIGVNTITIIVPAFTTYYAEINGICEDGSHSPNIGRTPEFKTLILDLVVQGFTPTGLVSTCTLTVGNKCYFPNSGVATFRVRQSNYPTCRRTFGIEKYPSTSRYKLRLNEPEPCNYQIYADYQIAPTYFRSEYEIVFNNQVVAIFVAEYNPVTYENWLVSSFILDGYEVVRMSSYEGEGGGARPSDPFGSERNDNTTKEDKFTTASPNPFSQALDVFLAQPAAEKVTLQLYNLSGQKVLDQQFAGGQEQYSLSTTGLSTGFYMLRIEADGVVQTLKVIKSE